MTLALEVADPLRVGNVGEGAVMGRLWVEPLFFSCGTSLLDAVRRRLENMAAIATAIRSSPGLELLGEDPYTRLTTRTRANLSSMMGITMTRKRTERRVLQAPDREVVVRSLVVVPRSGLEVSGRRNGCVPSYNETRKVVEGADIHGMDGRRRGGLLVDR
jgi:hypothetical protein